MAYTVTLAGTATIADEWWVGTLPGGYFVTVGNTSADMYLRQASNPTVAVGTVAGGYYPSYVSANDVGDVYWVDILSGTSMGIHHVTESSGVLSVTNNGTATVASGGFELPTMTHDGTQIMGRYSSTVSGVTAATAGSAYTYSGASQAMAALPDRVVAFDSVDTIELWNPLTSTVLDSITDPLIDVTFANATFAPYGPSKAFFVCPVGTTPEDFVIGVLDCAGDTLSFDWITTTTTDWTITGAADCEVAVWGDVGTFIPRKDASPQAASLYVVDLTTGQVSSSSPTTAMFAGIEDQSLGFAGPSTVVAFHGSDAWTFWTVTETISTRPLLRQRQSPKRTPSRDRGVDLRQRQTPFIA